MRDVNSQDIVQGVVNALRNEFGDDDYTYYIEDIPQGFKEPSFYIRTLNSSFELVCGRRYLRKNMMIVRYFPESEMKPRQEINAVLDRLFPVLEYIKMGEDLLRGTKMEANIEDNILHFNVNYDFFVIKPIKRPPVMQVLKQNQKLKR